ncbi:L-type lectin-domain containing receptor kinase S.4 [Trifolium repens]|nr:L-type lectin-domain containing receptor kinase S.4 [Trifolium repens]KAK2454559.1 L-type lectin-domain containing receptor kinase S.4 [Trifolium repens]
MAKTDLVVCFVILLFSIDHVKCDDEELLFDGFSGAAAASSNMSLSDCASIQPNGLLHLTNKTLGSSLTRNAFYSTPIKFKNSTLLFVNLPRLSFKVEKVYTE